MKCILRFAALLIFNEFDSVCPINNNFTRFYMIYICCNSNTIPIFASRNKRSFQ